MRDRDQPLQGCIKQLYIIRRRIPDITKMGFKVSELKFIDIIKSIPVHKDGLGSRDLKLPEELSELALVGQRIHTDDRL